MHVSSTPLEIMPQEQWRALQHDHRQWATAAANDRLARRTDGIKHPVEDFLWEYYPYSPGALRRWTPGAGIALVGGTAADELPPGFVETNGAFAFDALHLPENKREHLRTSSAWVLGLQRNTASRPAGLGCFGLHEWAMLLDQTPEQVRHNSWSLRINASQISDTIESVGLRCTHFDAWRFFTPRALELNPIQHSRATQPDFDQPGCLHANMDLYKWAMRLQPLIPSEFIRRAFELARRIRTVDMQSSPYDFSAMGLVPIRVETPAGRAAFATAQRGFAAEAATLRQELITLVEKSSLWL